MAKIDFKALIETAKFVVRFTVFLVPVIISWLAGNGFSEQAAALSATWAVLDRYIHLAKNIKLRGLWFF